MVFGHRLLLYSCSLALVLPNVLLRRYLMYPYTLLDCHTVADQLDCIATRLTDLGHRGVAQTTPHVANCRGTCQHSSVWKLRPLHTRVGGSLHRIRRQRNGHNQIAACRIPFLQSAGATTAV